MAKLLHPWWNSTSELSSRGPADEWCSETSFGLQSFDHFTYETKQHQFYDHTYFAPFIVTLFKVPHFRPNKLFLSVSCTAVLQLYPANFKWLWILHREKICHLSHRWIPRLEQFLKHHCFIQSWWVVKKLLLLFLSTVYVNWSLNLLFITSQFVLKDICHEIALWSSAVCKMHA
jgi:hypothetical protein